MNKRGKFDGFAHAHIHTLSSTLLIQAQQAKIAETTRLIISVGIAKNRLKST